MSKWHLKKVLYSVRQQDTAWYYMIHEIPFAIHTHCFRSCLFHCGVDVFRYLSCWAANVEVAFRCPNLPEKKSRAKLTAAMAPSLQHPRPCIVSKLQWKASAKCRIDSSSQKLNVFCLPKVWTSFNIQDQCSLVPNHDFWALGFYLENLHRGPRNLPRSTSFVPHRCQPGRNIVHWNDQPFHAQRLETRTGRCKGFGRWISFQTESSSGFIVSFRGNKSSLFFKGKEVQKPWIWSTSWPMAAVCQLIGSQPYGTSFAAKWQTTTMAKWTQLLSLYL